MSTNLSLSFELISLMGWFLRHHKEELTQLIEKATENGFMDELQVSDMKDFLHNTAASNEVVQEFFSFLEGSLQKGFEGKELDTAIRGALADEVKKVDGQVVDQHLLLSSIQKVKQESKEMGDALPTSHVKKLLCEQLLKQWDPSHHDKLN
ncbi:hypothetical protein COB28_01045 [Candidatus Dependentiae bacterium]|nr:MAG: hypothetical protein COB28_01045 [Candidatus Dependentiae bacterium]